MHTIKLMGAVPIPVGHRVEVCYFNVIRNKGGLFGGATPAEERLETPRVTDLETGIVYAHASFAKVPEGFSRIGRPNVQGLGARDAFDEVAESIIGVVRACQVTYVNNEHVETWLDVAPT